MNENPKSQAGQGNSADTKTPKSNVNTQTPVNKEKSGEDKKKEENKNSQDIKKPLSEQKKKESVDAD